MTTLSLLSPATTTIPNRRTSYAVERWLDWAVVAGLLLVVGVVTGYGLSRYPALNGDEGIYTAQAHAVMHGALAPYTYTYDHPFFGWVQIAGFSSLAQALHLGGSLSVVNTRFVMLLLALVNVPLVYGIARRLDMPRLFAAGTVALFALSPLTVDLARQVYLDNIALPWVLLAFYLALNPKRNQWLFAASGAAFAVGILSKETVGLLLPALVYVMVQRTVRNLRMMAFAATGAVFTLLVLIYPLFALLRNELLPGKGHVSLWTNGIMYQLASRAGSGSLWQDGSARQQLWDGWLTFDKVLIYSGLLAAGLAVASLRLRPFALAVGMAFLPVVKPGGYLPAMYVIVALPFLALCVGGVLSRTWVHIERTINARRSRWQWVPVLSSLAVFSMAVTGLALIAAVKYQGGDKTLMSTDAMAPAVQTVGWLRDNVAPVTINGKLTATPTVLNDDAFAVDLYRMGFGPWQAVSYYKYDLDPSARTQIKSPVAFIVDTPQMRSDVRNEHLTRTAAAIAHSTVVRTFGSGEARIEIRQVTA